MSVSFKQLKDNAKTKFTAKYWWFVLTSFLMGLLGIGFHNAAFAVRSAAVSAGNSFSNNNSNVAWNDVISNMDGLSSDQWATLGAIGAVFATALLMIVVISLVVSVFTIAFKVFVRNPILVGANRYIRDKRDSEPPMFETAFSMFRKGRYGNVVKTLFLRDLYVWLWSLLLIVPGIIASYRYMMVPYILADHPEMTTKEALQLSCDMMDGHKGEAFLLDCTFIGWRILSIVWPVGVFWVNPYQRLTFCEYYDVIKAAYESRTQVVG